jgi:hypothetical protein
MSPVARRNKLQTYQKFRGANIPTDAGALGLRVPRVRTNTERRLENRSATGLPS